jgi:hypothetical protein
LHSNNSVEEEFTLGTFSQLMLGGSLGLEGLVSDLGRRAVGMRRHSGGHLGFTTGFESEG